MTKIAFFSAELDKKYPELTELYSGGTNKHIVANIFIEADSLHELSAKLFYEPKDCVRVGLITPNGQNMIVRSYDNDVIAQTPYNPVHMMRKQLTRAVEETFNAHTNMMPRNRTQLSRCSVLKKRSSKLVLAA